MAEHTYYESKPIKEIFFLWTSKMLLFILFFYACILGPSFFAGNEGSFGFIYGINKISLFLAIGLIPSIVVYFFFLYKTYFYKITDRGIYFTGGIFVRRQKFVPFFKVTNVEITQDLIERIVGISRLSFQTAGNGGQSIPEIVFEGLEDVEKPKKLVYHLMEKSKKS